MEGIKGAWIQGRWRGGITRLGKGVWTQASRVFAGAASPIAFRSNTDLSDYLTRTHPAHSLSQPPPPLGFAVEFYEPFSATARSC